MAGRAGISGRCDFRGANGRRCLATRPEAALAHPGPVVDRPIRGGYRYVVTVPGVTPVGDNGVLPRRVERVVGAMNRIVDDHAF